ncbi:sensor histidine kinase [Aneurinibacillus sp. REN35]|uniref:sensor histidine kinase n=1 Tax=Aneurinibacillus sp. REN35 TaxID=3237286 RepID=UPI00352785C8
MRLQARIQLSTTVVSIVLLLIANTAIYFIFKNVVVSSEQSRLAQTAGNIVKELNTNKKTSMEQILQTYVMSDGVIHIINSKAVPLIQKTTNESKEYRNIPGTFKNGQFEGVVVYKGSTFIMASVPTIYENGEIVNLQVFENANALYENINDLKWVIVFATMSVIIILFVTGRFLGQVISSPIQRLTQTMKTIEEKKTYDQIDITNQEKDEIHEMAMTFNRMIAKLEESYAKQERFVSDASHELKTPLTVIDSYIKLLQRWGKERPDVLEEAIEAIGSEASRMKYVTEQLLELAKPEEMIHDYKEVVNIVPIVEKTIQRLQRTYDHTIEFHHEKQDFFIEVHEQSFVQVLIILIDNAKKYGRSRIEVGLKEQEQMVHLTVKDYGIGIPLEAGAHVFDRMYRVDKARSRKTGGSGLGLSIAKRIVEQHHGDILLESVEGKGSTFTVIFPKLEAL